MLRPLRTDGEVRGGARPSCLVGRSNSLSIALPGFRLGELPHGLWSSSAGVVDHSRASYASGSGTDEAHDADPRGNTRGYSTALAVLAAAFRALRADRPCCRCDLCCNQSEPND